MKSYLPNERAKVRTLDQVKDFPCLARMPNSTLIFLVSEKGDLDDRYLEGTVVHEASEHHSFRLGSTTIDLNQQVLEVYDGKVILET